MNIKISIKELVDNSGKTQTQIANETGISRTTISALYNEDSQSIKLEIIEKLYNVFRCTPNDIIQGPWSTQNSQSNYNPGFLEFAQKLYEDKNLFEFLIRVYYTLYKDPDDELAKLINEYKKDDTE